MFLHLFTACFLICVWALPAHAELSQHQEHKIDVNGVTRTFQIHYPVPMPVNLKNGLPLVIVLHGGRSSGEQIAKASRFSAKADKQGFITVYPDGTGKIEGRRLSWNAGDCCDIAMEENASDIAFIEQIIDYMIKFQGANPHHIYLAGLSNGGMLAYRAGAELSNRLAGIGTVEGGMFASQSPPKAPVSILIIHGLKDKTIPFEGGKTKSKLVAPYMKGGATFLSTQAAFDFWRTKNGCRGEPATKKQGRVVTTAYHQCRAHTVTALQIMDNGAHNWPGSPKMVYSEFDDGSNYMGHDATDVLWDFFSQQRNNNIPPQAPNAHD